MRLFLFKLALIVLPVSLLVCFTNYFVDPANVFISKEYISGIASILSTGNNVDNIANYDERMLQEQMILKLTKTPDIIVLGSSRIMQVGADFFPGKTVLNCGVSHATMHDLVGLVGLLDSLQHLPKELIINLDPFLFGKNAATEWQTLDVYYKYFLKRYASNSDLTKEDYRSNLVDKIYAITSFDYFRNSIEFVLKGTSKKYYDIGNQIPQIYGRFSDGTICYPSNYTHPDILKVSSDAWSAGIKEGLDQPDSAKIYLLNALIDFLKERHIKMHFVIVPFHPDFYRAVNSSQPFLFEKYRTLYFGLAAKKGIPITGNFDALQLQMSRSSFYDKYHCSKAAIQSIGITN